MIHPSKNLEYTLPIVLYSHSDYSDIWPSVFTLLKKYHSDRYIYFIVDDKCNTIEKCQDAILNKNINITYDFLEIKEQLKIYTYNPDLVYSNRLQQVFENNFFPDYYIFMHEDMLPINYSDNEKLKYCTNILNDNNIDFIKLIRVGDDQDMKKFYDNLVYSKWSKFSIQPTICKHSSFKNRISNINKNIYDLELSQKEYITDLMYIDNTEIKKGKYHYDSKIFPYIATAIVKGKWNYLEYANELTELVNQGILNIYDINKRGTNAN